MWIINASGWLFKKESITMHGNMNVGFLSMAEHSKPMSYISQFSFCYLVKPSVCMLPKSWLNGPS